MLAQLIRGVPKAELHLHIEGTLEPDLRFQLAKRNGIRMPFESVEMLRTSYNFNDLSSFLNVYYPAMEVLVREQDFYDLTYAYLSKVRSQNVVYAEIFFDPQAHTDRGVSFDTVIQGIHRAQQDGISIGIESQLIMCILRDRSVESAEETLQRCLSYKNWIIGIGLDSDERNNPPVKFKKIFDRARREGFMLTMHCDVDQVNSINHIRQCIHEIGVDRIDHGVNILEDSQLVSDIQEKDLALTVCPVSNRFVTDGLKGNELKKLLDLGVRVTVNSDDPAYFQAYLVENFEALHKEIGLSVSDILTLSKNSFRGSWLTPERKQFYLDQIDSYEVAKC